MLSANIPAVFSRAFGGAGRPWREEDVSGVRAIAAIRHTTGSQYFALLRYQENGMSQSIADVMKLVKENDVKFVDFRFTDTKGKEQHVSVPVSHFDEDKFESGHAFDGSSIAGWKGIEASDMLLVPDANTAHVDPFYEEPTLVLTCDVVEPTTCVFDGNGRMFVGEMRTYMQEIDGKNEHTPGGRVSMHWSSRKDGVMDKHSVFIDHSVRKVVLLGLGSAGSVPWPLASMQREGYPGPEADPIGRCRWTCLTRQA